MDFVMYVCPECRKVFKVKGNNKKVKCSKCSEKYLIDLGILQEAWNGIDEAIRKSLVDNAVVKSNSADNDLFQNVDKQVDSIRNNGKGIAFKCKMCGGQLEVMANESVCTCDYCGTTQTLPSLSDEKRASLYDRANHFRRNNEFDKAMGIYEHILSEDDSDAEAYWSIVLCRYGIEYVEDPTSRKRKPTVNRTQPVSILNDSDYHKALENADSLQKRIYEEEAKEIDRIQREIISIVHNEQPFDIFISYKETSPSGQRTKSSVLAQDLYEKLVEAGYRVFFSRITLEDKLGQQFEPYIYSALSTAKIMLVIGTDRDEFNAPWVRNEWGRFLGMMKSDKSKLLIPCFRDMDAYDIPEEMAVFQCQDMSKVGFEQDLLRGIKKIAAINIVKSVSKETVIVQQEVGENNASLIKRGNMALEDGEWQKADKFFEEVLNRDAECAEAYLGKWLAKIKESNLEGLIQHYERKYDESQYEKLDACPVNEEHIKSIIRQYTTDNLLSETEIELLFTFNRQYETNLSCRKQQKDLALAEINSEKLYIRARQYAKEDTRRDIDNAIAQISSKLDERIHDAQNESDSKVVDITESYQKFINQTDNIVQDKYDKAFERRESRYQAYINEFNDANEINLYKDLKNSFKELKSYKESDSYIKKCDIEIERLTKESEEAELIRKAKEKTKVIRRIIGVVFALVFLIVCITVCILLSNNYKRRKYNEAVQFASEGNYKEAIDVFEKLGSYKDAIDQINNIKLKLADVGQHVYFGKYEQDNDASDGKEDIEWLVLERDGDKVLLISYRALDYKQYSTTDFRVSWEKSALRAWLNENFLGEAFTDDDQKIVLDTTVTADNNPEYDMKPGNDTIDKVFILSIIEANKYFPTETSRQCGPSEYVRKFSGQEHCWWWLRSNSDETYLAPRVDDDGCIHNYDPLYISGDPQMCLPVRPAIWVNVGDR